jgi:hypothetical protein
MPLGGRYLISVTIMESGNRGDKMDWTWNFRGRVIK